MVFTKQNRCSAIVQTLQVQEMKSETSADLQSSGLHSSNQTWLASYKPVLSTLCLCQNSYWKLPFIVDLPIKHGDFPVRKLLVYINLQFTGVPKPRLIIA